MSENINNLTNLKDCLSYNQETGIFMWTKLPHPNSKNVKLFTPIERNKNHGYVRISYKGHSYRAHRLAWWFVHGRLPSLNIDHINGDTCDNRIDNLREVTQQVNMRNLKVHRQNRPLGVVFAKRNKVKKWEARSYKNDYKHPKFLGYFNTIIEAQEAIKKYEGEEYEQTKSH